VFDLVERHALLPSLAPDDTAADRGAPAISGFRLAVPVPLPNGLV
jgi:hypothetical protein